mmetsp:Transcript_2278/g.4579  ORF Transcript_2278/g.4579 Transcript_2278/m.4579 type:complete len:439 (-) Transcript_2278:127-1443(-)
MTTAQIREQLADCRNELQDMRDEVAEAVRSIKTTIERTSRAVVTLQKERSDHERERTMLRQSLKDKEHVEKELRETLSSSRASMSRPAAKETPTLMKTLEEKDVTINAMQREIDSLSAAVERAQIDAARSASMAVVQSRGSVSSGEVVTLTAQIDARAAEVAQLQGAMDAQNKSHQMRLAELQECFQAKIRELRRGYEDQMASMQAEHGAVGTNQQELEDAKKRAEAAESALREAEAKHRNQVQQLVQQIARFEGDEQSLAADKRKLQAQVERLKLNEANLKASSEELFQEVQQLRQRLESEANPGPGSEGLAGRPPPAEEQEALDLMEAQLVRLSNIIQAKEHELAAMRLTVQAECAERAELQRVVHQLTGGKEGPAGGDPRSASGSGAGPSGAAAPPPVSSLPAYGKPPASPVKRVTTAQNTSYLRRSRHGNPSFR